MRRRTYYQYYTNVTYLTCPDCLGRHGRIARSPEAFPKPNDSCEHRILSFPRKELKERREAEKTMRRLAKAEVARRALFREATLALGEDDERALELFARAARVDLYIPDLEELFEKRHAFLNGSSELRHRLRDLFARAYSDKFGWPRYELLPERMRIARENAGLERIKELFG